MKRFISPTVAGLFGCSILGSLWGLMPQDTEYRCLPRYPDGLYRATVSTITPEGLLELTCGTVFVLKDRVQAQSLKQGDAITIKVAGSRPEALP